MTLRIIWAPIRKFPPHLFMNVVRCVHWILARVGVFQGICLSLWLSERAKSEDEPPIHPWIIYTHIAVGFIASTGISVRCLSHLSTMLLVGSHLHMAWTFATEPKLGYNHCLRARICLRCIQSSGIYLRMIGTSRRQHVQFSKTYIFGLTLQSIACALLGFLSFPSSILQVDPYIQTMEQSSSWSFLVTYLDPFLSTCLALGFLFSTLIYSLFQMNLQSMQTFKSLGPKLLGWSDLVTAFCVLLSGLFRDANLSYWVSKGGHNWLQGLVLLEDLTIILGLAVVHDLAGVATQRKSKPE